MLDAAHLPDDIAALKALLLGSEARVAHLSAELSTRTAEIEHRSTCKSNSWSSSSKTWKLKRQWPKLRRL